MNWNAKQIYYIWKYFAQLTECWTMLQNTLKYPTEDALIMVFCNSNQYHQYQSLSHLLNVSIGRKIRNNYIYNNYANKIYLQLLDAANDENLWNVISIYSVHSWVTLRCSICVYVTHFAFCAYLRAHYLRLAACIFLAANNKVIGNRAKLPKNAPFT